MRQLSFTTSDAAAVIFGISCQWEVITSLRVLTAPTTTPLHRSWTATTKPLLNDQLALLVDLVGSSARGDYVPDFLTPPPAMPTRSLDAELDIVRRTPPDVVRGELLQLRHRWTPRVAQLYDDPRRTGDLVEQIRRYWDLAVAPYWPRIRRVLDGEVFLRSQQLATDGVGSLLNDLHDRVTWDGIRLHVAGTTCVGAVALEGTGLRLVPSAFVWPGVLVVADQRPAQLAFPARGAATLWDRGTARTARLEHVLGRARARLLTALDIPASSRALAAELDIAAATVSEQLAALRAAGLVTSHRNGRQLINVRTDLGTGLVDAGNHTPDHA
jgi:biotin operon repressor